MKIFNKDNFWWKNIEKNWVIKDKSGDWWIFKKDKPLADAVADDVDEPRNEKKPSSFAFEQYLILILSTALGSLLAFTISLLMSM